MYQRSAKTKRALKTIRSAKGAGLVEGVTGLVMVMGGLIIAILLMMNTGMAMYLKGKIAFVAQQTARHATGLQEQDRKSQSTEFAKDLAARMGMDVNSTEVEVGSCTVAGEEAVDVKISSSMATFGGVDWLPKTVAMSDNAVAVIEDGSSGTYGYLTVRVQGNNGYSNNGDLYVPVVRPKTKGNMSTTAPGGVNMTNVAKPISRLVTQSNGMGGAGMGAGASPDLPGVLAEGKVEPFHPFAPTGGVYGSGSWINPGQNTVASLH